MEGIKASAAAAKVQADDSMVIGGSILPHYASGQEGKLRACAVVLEGEEKLCLVSCDVGTRSSAPACRMRSYRRWIKL
ncbi:MAG TPA: hypothetical protein EYP17_02360 [Candidatus Latescibacteria bacterium]|nr:hypothetical protein [Candidatus Latescibacterota bacterium]